MFLDSHCEVNVQWLEPLLTVVAAHKRPTIAIPVIDIINAGTFEYTESPLVKGGFNWGLNFKWENLPQGYFKGTCSCTVKSFDFAGTKFHGLTLMAIFVDT